MKNKNCTVQEVLEIYKNAVHERNVEKFMSAYASDIHIYDCWGSWECNGKDSWRENVAAWFNGLKEEDEVLQVEFNDLVMEESVNIAFVILRCYLRRLPKWIGRETSPNDKSFYIWFEKSRRVLVHYPRTLFIAYQYGKWQGYVQSQVRER